MLPHFLVVRIPRPAVQLVQVSTSLVQIIPCAEAEQLCPGIAIILCSGVYTIVVLAEGIRVSDWGAC